MAESSAPKRARSYDSIVFGVSATLTILFVLWSALFPAGMETVVTAVFSWATERFPLMFLLLLVLYGTFKGLGEYRRTEV